MTRALILILALPLSGCPALDIIENKPSPYKAAHEQRTALVTPVVASVAEPVIEPVDKETPASEQRSKPRKPPEQRAKINSRNEWPQGQKIQSRNDLRRKEWT